ncbi:hypothetical protein [Streptacidiphilus jiangxiensis]|uniref:hypothetical protein n=1 Tax=Streptacidiphilus jiangxiensis TaxID=235985 RepID=UPI001160298C|nr:hypothetical protein [Streptacidiphilus jiangxiensis]
MISEQAAEYQRADVQDPAQQRHAALAHALAGAVGRPLTRCTWIPGTAHASEVHAAITTANGPLITYAAGGVTRTEAGVLALHSTTEATRPSHAITLRGLAEAVGQASAPHKLQILDLRASPDVWSSIAEHPELLSPPNANTAVIGHIRLAALSSHSLSHSYTWTELLTCVIRDGIRGVGPVLPLGELATSLPPARSLSRDRSVFVLYEGDWRPFLNPTPGRSAGEPLARCPG